LIKTVNSKKSSIVKYYYNLKELFKMYLIPVMARLNLVIPPVFSVP